MVLESTDRVHDRMDWQPLVVAPQRHPDPEHPEGVAHERGHERVSEADGGALRYHR